MKSNKRLSIVYTLYKLTLLIHNEQIKPNKRLSIVYTQYELPSFIHDNK